MQAAGSYQYLHWLVRSIQAIKLLSIAFLRKYHCAVAWLTPFRRPCGPFLVFEMAGTADANQGGRAWQCWPHFFVPDAGKRTKRHMIYIYILYIYIYILYISYIYYIIYYIYIYIIYISYAYIIYILYIYLSIYLFIIPVSCHPWKTHGKRWSSGRFESSEHAPGWIYLSLDGLCNLCLRGLTLTPRH